MTDPATLPRPQELLEAATPLPWTLNEESFDRVFGTDGMAITDDCCTGSADAALIVYAVNHLPDYEAAVEALAQLLDHHENTCSVSGGPGAECVVRDDARAALARLRGGR